MALSSAGHGLAPVPVLLECFSKLGMADYNLKGEAKERGANIAITMYCTSLKKGYFTINALTT